MHIHGPVIATCKELGIAVIAYSWALFSFCHQPILTPNSPLGRGLLTGQIRNLNDFEGGDYRRTHSRFHDDVRPILPRFPMSLLTPLPDPEYRT